MIVLLICLQKTLIDCAYVPYIINIDYFVGKSFCFSSLFLLLIYLQKMSRAIKTSLNLISFSSFNSGESFPHLFEYCINSMISINVIKTSVDTLLGLRTNSMK